MKADLSIKVHLDFEQFWEDLEEVRWRINKLEIHALLLREHVLLLARIRNRQCQAIWS